MSKSKRAELTCVVAAVVWDVICIVTNDLDALICTMVFVAAALVIGGLSND